MHHAKSIHVLKRQVIGNVVASLCLSSAIAPHCLRHMTGKSPGRTPRTTPKNFFALGCAVLEA